ncbi:Uncharacterised protein PB.3618, partial [Pycnogonum litorale]
IQRQRSTKGVFRNFCRLNERSILVEMIMLTFAAAKVLVMIPTVFTWRTVDLYKCEKEAVTLPCTCKLSPFGYSKITCNSHDWTAIMEALPKISVIGSAKLKISNEEVVSFNLALIKHIEASTLVFDFPNLVEIKGDMFKTRMRMAIYFLSGSFSTAPLDAIKHIDFDTLKIQNNANVKRIGGKEYTVLENPTSLHYLYYTETGLTDIENEAFIMLTDLYILNLGYNKLHSISPKILSKINSLDDINLSHNEFRRFPHKFVKFYISLDILKEKRFRFNDNKLTNGMNKDDWKVIMNSTVFNNDRLAIYLSGIAFDCNNCALSPIAERMNRSLDRSNYSPVKNIGGKCSSP